MAAVVENQKEAVARMIDQAVASSKDINYPKTDFQLENHPIDEVRPLKVAVIGGGLSGILAGIMLPLKVPGIQLKIFEKNKDLGGTWVENVYPGVRCDVPAHVYQSTFDPNTEWSEMFAEGTEIRDYWQKVAKKHDVYRYADFGKKITRAEFNENTSKWDLDVVNVDNGQVHEEEFDFIVAALGRFNAWKLPNYPGLDEYEGHLRHASNWDPSFDATGKSVAVIGNGASGIQVVPNLQRIVKHLDHYARSPTWIALSWGGDERTYEAQPYSKEELESFKDPKKYLAYRKEFEGKYWRRFGSQFRGSSINDGLRETFIEIMKRRTQKKPELINKLIPDFAPNCRRLTPGPGYLEALCEPNVEYITDPIKRFTMKGIETEDGTERPVDAIICCTGANTDFAPTFPIVSRGHDLKSAWTPEGEYGFPYTYLGMAAPDYPNFFVVGGPHGTGAAGSIPHNVETQITYLAKVLRKISSQGIKTITPSKKAVDDFVKYSDAFFPTTVLTDNCSSWANGGRPGSRIHGMWPGSARHVTFVRREPRWEDFEYEYVGESGNRFAWFGNGWTEKELDPSSDVTTFLKLPEEVDIRDVHESWWDI